MIIYNASYELLNSSLSKEPRWVAAIDFTGAGGWHYFTSHADALLPAGATDYTHSVLKVRKLASQTLTPKEGRASIGAISFDLLDINSAITTLIQQKLDAGYGLNKKTVRIYKGYAELTDFDTEYELVATQIVSDSVTFDKSSVSWQIKCADAQRLLKKNIFIKETTNITATVEIVDTTINVGNALNYEMLDHDAGYSDAPSSKVGYIKLKKSNSEFEIIRYTDKTPTSFTGCTRGVMGTKALRHEYTIGDEADRQIEVEEYIYLEGPIFKIAYAVITGSLYGQAGKTLPSGWHLGISTDFVSTASFAGIGADIWDTTDPTLGHQCRFQGIGKQEGKKFFETELMLLAGCFHYVQDDGQIAVRRMADASPAASTLGTLNASNVINANSLENTLSDLSNLYRVTWNWEDLLGRYTRDNVLVDGTSIATHQLGAIKDYEFRGMYGNRYTVDRIYQRFDTLRSMYAGPPLQLSVTTLGTHDMYEVGDTVRVTLDGLRDFTNGTQHTLDRAFMVFGKSVNAATGQPTYKLFGSSQKAGAIPPPSISGLSAVLPDSFYSSELNAANEIEYLATGGVPDVNKFEVVGGVGILKTDITCTGVAGNVNHVDSVFWYDGELEIASGVTVTVVNGAQFRVRGYFDNKGTISGKGQGLTGATGSYSGTAGTIGAFGTTRAWSGIRVTWNTLSNRKLTTISSPTAVGPSALPAFTAEYSAGSLVGLPSDLRGTAGSGGVRARDVESGNWVAGGAGGNSGAGVIFISRGFNTLSGSIDVSGDDGVAGGSIVPPYTNFHTYAGAGSGGAPGGLLFVIDGASNGVSGTSKIVNSFGACPQPGSIINSQSVEKNALDGGYYSGYYAATPAISASSAAYHITYAIGEQTPQQDIPQTTGNDTAPTLVEVNNTPRTAAGNLSTIEITANDAGDSNYSYSNAYYRIKGTTTWTKVDVPASPETTQVVASDGTIYEVETRSVSTAGVESPGGTIAEITVANVTAPTLEETRPETLTNLKIPNVHGLELFEQGNNSIFTGKDAKFAWRITSATEYYEMGHEPTGLGADAGTLDQYFQDYRVRVYNTTGTLLREEYVTDNWYHYTFEKNAEDYKRLNASDGAYRTFRIEVVIRVTYTSAVSAIPAKLTVSNPAPELPTGVAITGNFQQIVFKYNPPADLDWTGARVWVGTSTGFARDDTTLVYDGPDTNPKINRLADGSPLSTSSTYYLRFALYDAHGKTGLNESAEYTVTLPVAISSDDVQSIIADKIATGTLGEAVALGGVLVASGTEAVINGTGPSAGNWRLDMGPVSDGGNVYVVRYHDGNGNSSFSIDNFGNPYFDGTITANAGQVGGWTISGSQIYSSNMWINAASQYFALGSSSFGNSGIQLQYNGGSPKVYFGDGGDDYIQYQQGVGVEIGKNTILRNADAYYNDSVYLHTFFESLDGLYTSLSTGGTVTLTSGDLSCNITTTSGSMATVSKVRSRSTINQSRWLTNRRMKIRCSIGLTTNVKYYIGIGQETILHEYVGFFITGGNLYGTTRTGTISWTVTDFSITVSDYTSHLFEVDFIAGTEANFYYDGSLVGTITTNLPNNTSFLSSDHVISLSIEATGTVASPTSLTTGEAIFMQDA